MASGGSDQVQDSLSCGVCLERFNSSNHLPKILPCEHTFCTSCIDSLIGNSLTLDAFDCPVCRRGVTFAELRTNLGVRDIVEAIAAKEKDKLFCQKHPAEECQLVCTDCCQLLCAVCVQGLVRGEHKEHTIDNLHNAKVKIKDRLTMAVKTKITNLEKATSTKRDDLKKEFAQQGQELHAIVYTMTEAINEWKETRLQTAQQAIDKELETSEAQQASWTEKLQVSDLQSMMSVCKEAEAEDSSPTNVSLPKVNLTEMRNQLSSLCDTMQTLITDNTVLPTSTLTPSSPEDTNKCCISFDFIVHLCSSAVPQKDPSKRPYIPLCVKRVSNTYNRNRNTQFLRVAHDKRNGKDNLLCKTDDFVYIYDLSNNPKHSFVGMWESYMSQIAEYLDKATDLLHDPNYITKIDCAHERWQKITMINMRNGKPELKWENHK